MISKTETTMLTADAAFKKSTDAKITMAKLNPPACTTKSNALPKAADSIDCAPVIEHYNNYTNAGVHSNTAHYLNQPETTSASQTEDDMMLPWWLVMMLRKANPSSEWIKQMLEEAGLENIDTDKITAAEELLESFGGNSETIQSD